MDAKTRDFKLNYLPLLAPYLTSNTPLCVIEEILDAHGFEHCQLKLKHHDRYLTAIKSSIETTPSIIIPITLTDSMSTFKNIARFINSHAKWDKASLITALSNIVLWYDDSKVLAPKDFTIGLATPQYPHSLSASILYLVCCRNKITSNQTTTIGELNYKVRLLSYSRTALLQQAYAIITMMTNDQLISLIAANTPNNATDTLSKVSRNELINCKLHSDTKQVTTTSQDSRPTFASLLVDYEQLHNMKALQKMIIPTTASQAVALSAILYQSDISNTSNPQLQYLARNNCFITCNDKHLTRINNINPGLLSLKKTFNPLFAINYYSTQDLTAMLRRETQVIPSDLSDKYQRLALAYLCENFYHGLQPEVSNKTSLIELVDIDEVKANEIVCYGTRNQSMIFYKLSELTDLFVANNNFINPSPSTNDVKGTSRGKSNLAVFSDTAISKLKILATSLSSNNDWQALLQAIIKVEEANKDISDSARNFRDCYRRDTTTNYQVQIKAALSSLLRVSMFMRGWDESRSSLPIEISLVKELQQPAVDLRVTQEMTLLYKLLTGEGKIIGELPLVRYLDQHFIPSNSKDDGLTIKDRLDIVRDGATTASCIRLSSNWLAASAYHYMIILGLDRPFDITKLRNIS